jgi:hypothetical protein
LRGLFDTGCAAISSRARLTEVATLFSQNKPAPATSQTNRLELLELEMIIAGVELTEEADTRLSPLIYAAWRAAADVHSLPAAACARRYSRWRGEVCREQRGATSGPVLRLAAQPGQDPEKNEPAEEICGN